MKNKLTFSIILCAAILAFGGTTLAASKNTASSATVTQDQSQRMENLKQRADKEIDRRITELTMVSSKIDSIKKLSDSQKTDLKQQIQTNNDNLATLKSKIEDDTDLTTLKTDVQSIVDSYRIFALFIPKIHMFSAIGIADEIIGDLETLSTQLQTKINVDKTAGKDVSSLETLLVDMNTKVTDAKTVSANAETALIPLQPQGYPNNRTTLLSVREQLRTLHQDLVTARQDAGQIRQGLKTLEVNKQAAENPQQ